MTARRAGVRIRHRGHEPRVHPSAFIAPTATLVGDVLVGPRTDRVTRYERSAEVRVEEFGAHLDDEPG